MIFWYFFTLLLANIISGVPLPPAKVSNPAPGKSAYILMTSGRLCDSARYQDKSWSMHNEQFQLDF